MGFILSFPFSSQFWPLSTYLTNFMFLKTILGFFLFCKESLHLLCISTVGF